MSVNKVKSDGSLLRVAGGGGSGLFPHLIIISEDGESEVKAVKGSTEIIATRTSAGHYECDVPEFGTWTIHAVLNGDDAVVNLVVDTVKIYTVSVSHFRADITVTFPHSLGATCALSATGQTTQYATSSPYDFTVHEAGTYTLTVSYDGTDYTETITVTATGQEFESLLPAPEDVPTSDINLWLFYADIDNSESTYSSLADILADTTALSALMTSQNAVDYMVRNTSWATDITASEDAMTYIGLNNYCANTLLDDETTWRIAICNSAYFEEVLNVKNPAMTSNTTPEGQCFANASADGWPAWKAFDKVVAWGSAWKDAYDTSSTRTRYIGYRFAQPRKIYRYEYNGASDSAREYPRTFVIQGSDDGSNWTNLMPNTSGSADKSGVIDYPGEYLYYRLLSSNWQMSGGGTLDCAGISELQFYGREDV